MDCGLINSATGAQGKRGRQKMKQSNTPAEFSRIKHVGKAENAVLFELWRRERFVNERSLPGIEITACGHECILYPRSHCELNYIEFFWGVVKRYI